MDITGVDSAANLMSAVNYLKQIRNMTFHDSANKIAQFDPPYSSVDYEAEGPTGKEGGVVQPTPAYSSRPDLLASFQEWTRNAALVLQDLTGQIGQGASDRDSLQAAAQVWPLVQFCPIHPFHQTLSIHP